MGIEPVLCPTCESINVFRYGRSAEGKSRYRCLKPDCQRNTFILDYSYQGRVPKVKFYERIAYCRYGDDSTRLPSAFAPLITEGVKRHCC
jgi:transposase-like protein